MINSNARTPKTLLTAIALFLWTLAIFSGAVAWLALSPKGGNLAGSHNAQPAFPDSSTWMAAVQSQIASQEYQVRSQGDSQEFASPNRQQNLRITYREDGFSIKPRVDSVLNWHLDYTVAGVFRGGSKVVDLPAAPTSVATGATLKQDFGNGFHIFYTNGPEGMRQNFLMDHKPCGNGPLRLRLDTQGSLYPVQQSAREVILVEQDRETASIQKRAAYKDLRVWDSKGVEIPACMHTQDPTWNPSTGDWTSSIDLQVDDQNAVYPLWIDPISTTASTVLESNQAGAWFGYSVTSAGDVNGDGYSDIVVGSPTYDNGQFDEGAAFIFHGSPTGVGLGIMASMEADQANAFFGISCSSAGDVNGDGYSDVIIGASQFNKGIVREGIAVIYYGSATGINATVADTMETNQMNAFFGQAVGGLGDVNGDGFSDVIVGAPSYDNGEVNEGIACIYHGSATGIVAVPATLMESNQVEAKFGVSVASAGDVNGDGFSDAIIGAYLYDGGQADEGGAFIYHGSSTGVSAVPALILESNQASGQAGTSVASAGDVNGDGFSDVVVGSPSFSNGQPFEGVAFVFYGSGTGIQPSAPTLLECNQINVSFGLTVASGGDVNGDGFADVIVGAPSFTNGQNAEGAAFLYYGQATGLDTNAEATFEVDQADAAMGVSVASAGDVNGDGFSDVIVGAIFYDLGQTDEGLVQVYHGAARTMSTTPGASFELNQASASFGCSVASAGDVNGDGYTDMIVGARQFDNGQVDEGAAFLFHGGASGLGPSFAVQLESDQANAGFGVTVAGAGDVNGDGYADVIVGADLYDNGQVDEGAAFIFRGSATGILLPFAARLELNQAGARLGYAVASAGDVNGDGYADVVVGAPYSDNGQADEGEAFTYHGDSLGIITTFAQRIESNQAGALLGWSVSSAGDVNGDGYSDVILGAPAFDNGQTDEGAAFVHHGSVLGIGAGPAAILETNQALSALGHDVSSAGDVNGDGFSEVVVGATAYDNGQADEGAAFVYYGSTVGINSALSDMLECNQAAARMGQAVAAAGDLNGDGYGDLVIGADEYANGQSGEGAAFIFDGSPGGILLNFSAMVEFNQAGAQLGHAVASAGDPNGDGFSDVIVGAVSLDNGQTDEGGAMVYFGNGGQGRRVICEQRRVVGPQTVGPGALTGTVGQVRFSMVAKSFVGNQPGLLEWEVVQNGDPFSSAGGWVSNSVSSSGSATGFTPLSATGTPISQTVSGFNTQLDYKWRMRVRYNLTTAITGQIYGPWYYHKSASPEVPMMGFKARACPIDNNPPTALCQSVTVVLDSSGSALAIADSVNNGSTDNCSISGYSLNPSAFTCANLGSNTVTLTVVDGSGNSSTCTANIQVVAFPFSATAVALPASCGFHVSCHGGADGQATAMPAGGCPDFSYLWSTGDTTGTITGLAAGTYTVTIGDGLGSFVVDTVTLTEPPAWQLSTNSITASCSNDSTGQVDIAATGSNSCSAYGYLWSNGDTTEDLVAVAPGSYTVTVTDILGCNDTFSVVVSGLPILAPTFSQVGNTLVSGQAWNSYQWLLNGSNIPGATASIHVIATTGNYALQVTDSNGCTGTSSPSSIVGTTDGLIGRDALYVYPNPTRDAFRLRTSWAIAVPLTVTLRDVYGKRLFVQELPQLENEAVFELQGIASGYYFIDIVIDGGTRHVFRLLVQ